MHFNRYPSPTYEVHFLNSTIVISDGKESKVVKVRVSNVHARVVLLSHVLFCSILTVQYFANSNEKWRKKKHQKKSGDMKITVTVAANIRQS